MPVLDTERAPLPTFRDVTVAGLASVLALFSWILPQARWFGIAQAIAGARLAFRHGLSDEEVEVIQVIVGPKPRRWIETTFVRLWLGHKYHSWMQLLACYWPRRWCPATGLVGREHLDAALDAGRGVILFTVTFAYKDLMAKAALAQAGYSISHLSKDTHGFSESAFGKRWLNPIYTHVEERFLGERMVFSGDNTKAINARVRDRLATNKPVMITVTPLGRRVAVKRFLHGWIRIATGGLNIACERGTPVLPVFCLRQPDGTVATFLEKPLLQPANVDRSAMIDAMLDDYIPRLEAYVELYPEQFSFPVSEQHGVSFLSTEDEPAEGTDEPFAPKLAAG